MTIQFRPEIHVVDDDPAIRDALRAALGMEGFDVRGYGDAQSYLSHGLHRPAAAVLLDVHMPGRSGLDVLKDITDRKPSPPVLIISGHGDIPMAVNAVKQGAEDFIEKPFNLDDVIRKVQRAMSPKTDLDSMRKGPLAVLSRREIEIINVIASGASSKEAGYRLSISPRTVDAHRARIMDKLGVKNTAELMRLYFTAQAQA
jgi:two-component system, LuxR family, response regulator FixJ